MRTLWGAYVQCVATISLVFIGENENGRMGCWQIMRYLARGAAVISWKWAAGRRGFYFGDSLSCETRHGLSVFPRWDLRCPADPDDEIKAEQIFPADFTDAGRDTELSSGGEY